MKRSIKNIVILLAILTVATALLPITSMANQNACYLKADKEITFTVGDKVSQKAAELTKNAKTSQEKAMAIYSYIVTSYSYDYDLYNKIVTGKITRYTPQPNKIIDSRVGICYDIASLYAAMCRSVGVPTRAVRKEIMVVTYLKQ